jgi:hypothetical protein
MSEKVQNASFFIQDPFTEEVQGPLSVQDLKAWCANGGCDDWGVSKSPTGPWTPVAKVKGLMPTNPPTRANEGTGVKASARAPLEKETSSEGGGTGVRSQAAAEPQKPIDADEVPSTESPASIPSGNQQSVSETPEWLRRLKQTRGWEYVRRNPFLMMICGGCGMFLSGLFTENHFNGGIGLWTAIAGVVCLTLQSRFPTTYSKIGAMTSRSKIGAMTSRISAEIIAGTIFALGMMLFFFFLLVFDTTVATGTGLGRVHNIGLMNTQRNGIILGLFLMVAGGVLGGLLLYSRRAVSQTLANVENKACPRCGETIKRAAVVCKHCKSELSTN